MCRGDLLNRAMLGTGSCDKELGGGSIDIDFNLLSGSWECCGSFVWRWGWMW